MIKTTFIRFFTLLIFFSLLPIAVENSFPQLDGYTLQAEEKKKKKRKRAKLPSKKAQKIMQNLILDQILLLWVGLQQKGN